MKKNVLRTTTAILLFSLAMLLTLSGCSKDSSVTTPPNSKDNTSSGKKINIRIASSSPSIEFQGEGTTSLGISVNYFVKEIEARTGGRITAQVFPGGQIASSTQEYIGGLQNGAFDIGILNCGSWADYIRVDNHTVLYILMISVACYQHVFASRTNDSVSTG